MTQQSEQLSRYNGITPELLLSMAYNVIDISTISLPISMNLILDSIPGIEVETGFSWDDIVNSGYIKVIRNNDFTLKKILIWSNPSEAEVRRRFTFAHEVGHLINDVIPNLSNDSQEEIIDKLNRDSNQDYREVRANAFAAQLLMPAVLIKREVDNLIQKYQQSHQGNMPTIDYAITYLSGIFDVSYDAMKYRLINLGYVSK
ncbi:ImmA/IrrE family metallo-endopeptidase [Shewanella insulae]|uniref:ImmA/IrrE family metallo-endopeptidase n=1 Tax=Shewanella insulae TaxID=2681496 RepID=UPI002480A4DA|nr:ImmA/IrrE family metallo-endopeptidase [Shewanella insulae]